MRHPLRSYIAVLDEYDRQTLGMGGFPTEKLKREFQTTQPNREALQHRDNVMAQRRTVYEAYRRNS